MGAALEQQPDRKRLKLPWGKVLAGSALRPTAVAVVAAGGVAAAALQSLPVLAIGAIAFRLRRHGRGDKLTTNRWCRLFRPGDRNSPCDAACARRNTWSGKSSRP